jgi:hypothetical protein
MLNATTYWRRKEAGPIELPQSLFFETGGKKTIALFGKEVGASRNRRGKAEGVFQVILSHGPPAK